MNSKELAKDSLQLIHLAGKISRIDYINRMDALANKWDRFIIAEKGPGAATFSGELRKLVEYYDKMGFDLEEIPQAGPIMERKIE